MCFFVACFQLIQFTRFNAVLCPAGRHFWLDFRFCKVLGREPPAHYRVIKSARVVVSRNSRVYRVTKHRFSHCSPLCLPAPQTGYRRRRRSKTSLANIFSHLCRKRPVQGLAGALPGWCPPGGSALPNSSAIYSRRVTIRYPLAPIWLSS